MIKEKIKALISKQEEEPNKKKIENLVVFVIILIITVVMINVIWNENNQTTEEKQPSIDRNKKLASSVEEVQTSSQIEEDDITKKLENILSKMKGVGRVSVMITYSRTSQTVPLYNQDSSEKNTEESDKQGGTRRITETDTKTEIIYKEENGEKVPITQSIVSPTIEGAIVTAEGAGSAEVKTNIIQAVEAVTGVATHKIQVFEMNE